MGDDGLLFGGVARIVFSFYKWVANNDDPDDPVWPLFGLRVPLRRSRSLNMVSLPLPAELSPQLSQSQYDHKSWFKMAIIDISQQQLFWSRWWGSDTAPISFPPPPSELWVLSLSLKVQPVVLKVVVCPEQINPIFVGPDHLLYLCPRSRSASSSVYLWSYSVSPHLTICWRGFLKCKPIFVAEVCKIVRKDKSWYFSFLWTDTDSNYL